MDDFDDLFDPTGSLDVAQHPLAPALADLRGARLGILDNSKTNGDNFFRMLADILCKDFGVAEVKHLTKANLSQPADPALLREIATGADFAVTGIGD